MRRAAALAVATMLLVVPAATAGSRARPYVLTALADVGTVYWRFDCVHAGTPRVSLGTRIWQTVATTGVVFRTGKITLRRTLQPGARTRWFPFTANRLQSLEVSQMTEPRTLHAAVNVDFRNAACFVYEPPGFSAELYTNLH